MNKVNITLFFAALLVIGACAEPRKLLASDEGAQLTDASEHQRILAELEEVHQLRERMLQEGKIFFTLFPVATSVLAAVVVQPPHLCSSLLEVRLHRNGSISAPCYASITDLQCVCSSCHATPSFRGVCCCSQHTAAIIIVALVQLNNIRAEPITCKPLCYVLRSVPY